ncbi:MAG: Hsp20/alpha crystallin family protein [Deltaproteobacteria bacterium]|nr:MAG: Hsp20/alpha crystallin family protein [Deltaproteobacteria bacterium]
MYTTSLIQRNPDRPRPAVARWGDTLLSLDREVDDLFRDFFGGTLFAGARPAGFVPAVDVRETDAEIAVSVELPGLAPEDVDVSLEDDVLTIRGEKKLEREERDGERRRHVERAFGSFARRFRLTDDVDADAVTAVHKDGVLTVTLPKVAAPEARTIEIQAG